MLHYGVKEDLTSESHETVALDVQLLYTVIQRREQYGGET